MNVTIKKLEKLKNRLYKRNEHMPDQLSLEMLHGVVDDVGNLIRYLRKKELSNTDI